MLIPEEGIIMRAYASRQSSREASASAEHFCPGTAERQAAQLFEGSKRSVIDLARTIALPRLSLGSAVPGGLHGDRPCRRRWPSHTVDDRDRSVWGLRLC